MAHDIGNGLVAWLDLELRNLLLCTVRHQLSIAPFPYSCSLDVDYPQRLGLEYFVL